MCNYNVTVRNADGITTKYTAIAASSCDAWDNAAAAQGDTPCGITVTPVGGRQ